MATYNYKPGLGNAASYQVSSQPYLTSSLTVPASGSDPMEISFPYVTKFIVITNNTPVGGANIPLRFGISAAGVKGLINNNYGILNNGQSFEADFRVTKIYLMSDDGNQPTVSVIAGLTGIDQRNLVNNWSGSTGVG